MPMKPIPTLFLSIFASLIAFQAEASSWSIVREIPLGGEGGWDYLSIEPASHRLFVTHANHVLVLDLKTERLVGSLDSSGAHGVAFAPELNRGFISNGGSNTVTVFDLRTLRPLRSVKAGENPDAICYDPATKRVVAFNGRSHSASVLDAMTGNVVGEIPLPGKPEFAQADGTGFVFDVIEDKGLVIKIDVAKLVIAEQWALPRGSAPGALAIDVKQHRLFAGCEGKLLYVLDSQSGKIVAQLPIGDGVDAAVYDSAQKRVFASCGDGTLTVIDQKSPDDYVVETQIKTEHGARTMAFDSITQTAYLPLAKFGPPPAPTADRPHPYPSIVSGTLKLLVVKR